LQTANGYPKAVNEGQTIQWSKDKSTNNDIQNTKPQNKVLATQTSLKTRVNTGGARKNVK